MVTETMNNLERRSGTNLALCETVENPWKCMSVCGES